jgi:hypothetical protein
VEDRVPHTVGPLRVSGDAFWASQCSSLFSAIYSICFARTTERLLFCLYRQYLNFLQDSKVHQTHFIQVLERLKEHSLFASPKKCSFYADKVTFLGFSISSQGIKMELEKLNTIRNWPYL